jgi:hypothetical protein
VWGVFAVAALVVLLVVFVRQLRRTSEGPGTLIAAGIVSVLVIVGVVLLLVLR